MNTTNMKTPVCTQQIACDGENLNVASRERGYCGKCAAAMKKKAKGPAPLRGERIDAAIDHHRLKRSDADE
jgi:hypothetical protein